MTNTTATIKSMDQKEPIIKAKEFFEEGYLRKQKVSYVKAAVEAGYTFKEIGANISISAEAVNIMV